MIKWEFLGRLHPLVLHLPIGLIFGLLLIEGLALIVDRGARAWQACRRAYVALLSLSCVAAAATGYLLSLEGQASGITLTRHKWFGVSAAAVSLVLLFLAVKGRHESNGRIQTIFRLLVMWGLCGVMIVTGHLGGQLTHGPRFLSMYAPPALQPLLGPAPPASPEPAPTASVTVYSTVIQPILDNHCAFCHGPDQQKGQFAVHTQEGLMAGGRSGPAVLPGAPQDSELIKRILLPLEEAGHMPPTGKSQLSAMQMTALQWWIEKGASYETGFAKNEIPQALIELLPPTVSTAEQPDATSDPSPWDEDLIRSLMDQQISIQRIQQDDPRLWISFPAITNRVTDETVKQLLPLAPFIAWLDLSNTRITFAALPWIAQMPALTELNLRQTGVDVDALKSLAQHEGLQRLNLSGVPLDDTLVDLLLDMPNLKRVYLWGSLVSEAGLRRLSAPRIEVIADLRPSDVISTEPNEPNKP